ncbi:MAG: ATPase, T2SS/T4P/T4SS family [Eubacteriales bacterium]|nr:ATPase, T2SS/T4P/T4SS family [Eubacteriales bacterium]
MPIVTSHVQFAEQYASYRAQPLHVREGPSFEFDAPSLVDLIAQVCSKVLATEPALVADVAAARVERTVLENLIQRTADQESIKAGYYAADLRQQAMDFLFGYGPLQDYVDDLEVTDIDGTGPDEFTIKRRGIRQPIKVRFGSEKTYDTFCRLLIIRQGGQINENDSHCRVTDERYRLRINVTVPPRSATVPTVCIRKHRASALTLRELADQGMFPESLIPQFTTICASDQSFLICGKGASGKTTLLRAMIKAMPLLERIMVAESDSEIFPEKPYCLVQRIRKAHEGGRPVTLRDLVADGLTMSLDTYCIGEIVGDEALEFIRAAYSGHRCLATTHAESGQDALDRLLSLARPAAQGDSEISLRSMLAKGVDLIFYLRNFKLSEVIHVQPNLTPEGNYVMESIWQDSAPAT